MPVHLDRWLRQWQANSLFLDLCHVEGSDKIRLVTKLRKDIERLATILGRGDRQPRNPDSGSPKERIRPTPQLQLVTIYNSYVPPGHLKDGGPRHDNDHTNIIDISIAPTQQELMSDLMPFIPCTVHDAPHHLPMNSMERLMDIQFRLLREELL